jgi:hypothetical protein
MKLFRRLYLYVYWGIYKTRQVKASGASVGHQFERDRNFLSNRI